MRIFLVAIFVSFFAVNSYSQSPGGVTSNLKLWLQANTGVTGTTTVTAWNDQSGNGYNASATSGPELLTDRLNYNPALDFDGSEFMQITNGIFGTATENDVFVYLINRTNTVANSSVIREGMSGGDRFRSHLPWGDENVYWDFGTCCGSGRISTNWGGNVGVFNIWTYGSSTGTSTPSGTRKSIYRDGLEIASSNNNDNATGANNNFYIASTDGSSSFHTGELAEIIVYNGVPSSTELQQIHSYLAVKYGITVDQSTATNYLASNGSNIFAATTTFSGYLNDIAGIGRDDNSGLDQQQSISSNSDALVTMNKGGAFTNDLDFVVWGNNGESRNGTTVGAHPSYTYVIRRDWRVDLSGTPGSVSVSFELGGPIPNTGMASDYALLIDGTDTDYSSGATAHTTGAAIVGNTLTFTGVNFTDADYFSLGTQFVNPTPGAGDLSSLLWLRSDEGVTGSSPITLWADQSGNSNDGTANGPTLVSNALNYNPLVSFDGGNDNVVVTNGIVGTATQSDMFTYMVSSSDITASRTIFREELAGGDRYGSHAPWGNARIYYDFGSCCGTARINTPWGATVGEYYIWSLGSSTGTSTPSGTEMSIYRNASLLETNNSGDSGTGDNNDFHLGSTSGGGQYHNGDIAEFIVINDVPTSTEHASINSYLAIKYGIDIGDLTASDGTTVWNSAIAGYQNDVRGIANEENGDFLQKQSHSADDSIRVYVGTLAVDNPSNTATTADFGQNIAYIVMGHNADSLKATAASNAEQPGSVFARLEREWYVMNTNFTGTFAIDVKIKDDATYNLTASDLRLLVDADGDFSNATVYGTASGLSFSYASNVITVSGIGTTHIAEDAAAYITIASASSGTPLPVELLYFELSKDGPSVKIDWATSYERDNESFTLQRSPNAIEWLDIVEIPGRDDSNTVIEYSYTDKFPILGLNYYRLKQTDFDGTTSYSKIRSILNRDLSSGLEIFPNPVEGSLNIIYDPTIEIQLTLFDPIGKEVSSLPHKISRGHTRIETSEIQAGIYILVIKSEHEELRKKIFIK